MLLRCQGSRGWRDRVSGNLAVVHQPLANTPTQKGRNLLSLPPVWLAFHRSEDAQDIVPVTDLTWHRPLLSCRFRGTASVPEAPPPRTHPFFERYTGSL